ncbi:MAG: bifunctional phosphopantothenoylcysteine decarboxylase/phosphopantothenate--cysteine ligase CoaBC [Dongiaceae bacterium]
MQGKKILLLISGGIAAYKSLDLIRRLREKGASIRCIITAGGQHFITPMAVAALSNEAVYTDLWSLKDETEMGHIRLVREADVVLVAPASADILAKMANGLADDLATTALLANDKPLFIAPAMNAQMWAHPATQKNIQTLDQRGVIRIGPAAGDLACGEVGFGRMNEVSDIVMALENYFAAKPLPLRGYKALVTSGPTFEAIDPVRFIGNYSSGKQGHAIAAALAAAGADVTLVSGPTSLPDPQNCKVIHVQKGDEMWKFCEKTLPLDIAVCAAAVADWKVDQSPHKLKKDKGAPDLQLIPNIDILASLAKHRLRPGLLIGFAAETENLVAGAREKLTKKNCDWIIANDATKALASDQNQVYVIDANGVEEWPSLSKTEVAAKLVSRIIQKQQRKAA